MENVVLFNYNTIPIRVEDGPIFIQGESTGNSISKTVISNSVTDVVTVYPNGKPAEPACADFVKITKPSSNQYSILNINYSHNEGDGSCSIGQFVIETPNGKTCIWASAQSRVTTISDGIFLMGMSYSSSMSDIIDGVDYAYFLYEDFEITDFTPGLEFTAASSPLSDNVSGIFVVKIPNTGKKFSFSVKIPSNNITKTFIFRRPSWVDPTPPDPLILPAGKCVDEPTVTGSIPVNFTDSDIRVTVYGTGYVSHSISNGVLTVTSRFNPYTNQRETLHLGYDIGGKEYVYKVYQEGAPSVNPNTENLGIQYGGVSMRELLTYYNDSSIQVSNLTFEVSENWLSIDESTIQSTTNSCGLINVSGVVSVESNLGLSNRVATIKVYNNGELLTTTTYTQFYRDLNLHFNPSVVNAWYIKNAIGGISLVKNKAYIGEGSVEFNITDAGGNPVGSISTEPDVCTDAICSTPLLVSIPENFTNSPKTYIVTAVFTDGDFTQSAQMIIIQESLELRFNPAVSNIGAEGGTISTELITNVRGINTVNFSGDITPQLGTSTRSSSYNCTFTIPANPSVNGRTLTCVATVQGVDNTKTATFLVSQDGKQNSFNLNPNPLIIPAGSCVNIPSPQGTAQITSTYSQLPTIRTRDIVYNLRVVEYNNSTIIIAADYNPHSTSRVLGYLDFWIGDNRVGVLEVQQEAAAFSGSCVPECTATIPAEGNMLPFNIAWNDPYINTDDIVWSSDSPWLTFDLGAFNIDSCGSFSVKMNVNGAANNTPVVRIGTITGTIAGKTWNPKIKITQDAADKILYFGCNSNIKFPLEGESYPSFGFECSDLVKLYSNAPQESDVIISDVIGPDGLTIPSTHFKQISDSLWEKEFWFNVEPNNTYINKEWSLTATWGDKTAVLKMKQPGIPYIRCNPDELIFYKQGGTKTVTLDTNLSPEEIDVKTKLDNVEHIGDNKYSVTKSASIGTTNYKTITFSSKADPSISCTVHVLQFPIEEGEDYMFCIPRLVKDIPKLGGKYELRVFTSLSEDLLGLDWSNRILIPWTWELKRDPDNYKKATVTVPPYTTSPGYREGITYWFNTDDRPLYKNFRCATLFEQYKPPYSYLVFNPGSVIVDSKGGTVTTTLYSTIADKEVPIDYSGLKGLKYTVDYQVFDTGCDPLTEDDCDYAVRKFWFITVEVPPIDDYMDRTYSIFAGWNRGTHATFTIRQTGVPVPPADDSQICDCNLLDTIGLEAHDRYFKHLSQFGYKSYADVDRLLVLNFIGDILNSDMNLCISEEDYRTIMNALYCVIDNTCLVDYPVADVYDSLIHPILSDPDIPRITEDSILRYSERNNLRVEV